MFQIIMVIHEKIEFRSRSKAACFSIETVGVSKDWPSIQIDFDRHRGNRIDFIIFALFKIKFELFSLLHNLEIER
jgi:hypothetical protein